MPKWHGLDLGQEHPQELKTIKNVHTSQISRLIPVVQLDYWHDFEDILAANWNFENAKRG